MRTDGRRDWMANSDIIDSEDSDGSEILCPLCYGKMDKTDLGIFPCPCNFQAGEL